MADSLVPSNCVDTAVIRSRILNQWGDNLPAKPIYVSEVRAMVDEIDKLRGHQAALHAWTDRLVSMMSGYGGPPLTCSPTDRIEARVRGMLAEIKRLHEVEMRAMKARAATAVVADEVSGPPEAAPVRKVPLAWIPAGAEFRYARMPDCVLMRVRFAQMPNPGIGGVLLPSSTLSATVVSGPTKGTQVSLSPYDAVEPLGDVVEGGKP